MIKGVWEHEVVGVGGHHVHAQNRLAREYVPFALRSCSTLFAQSIRFKYIRSITDNVCILLLVVSIRCVAMGQ